MLRLGGLAEDPDQARAAAQSALDSGRAAEHFARMVSGQGGPADLLDRPDDHLPGAAVIRPVLAERTGFVQRIDMRAIGAAVVDLGGGRQRAEDDIDRGVGLSRIARPGTNVEPGTELAWIHAAGSSGWEAAAEIVKSAMRIGPEPGETSPVIQGRVEGRQT
jgi:thymidine phosphorylase